MKHSTGLMLASSALCALGNACVVTGTAPAAGEGSAVVDWTIDEAKDPSECRQSDVDSVSVQVYTLSDAFVGEYADACEAFETRIFLPPGDYTADASLLDSTGQPRTTAVRISQFSIYGSGDVVNLPIDFPSSAFF